MSSVAESAIGPSELRNIGLFGALSDDVLEYLSSLLTVETPPAGATLFREGEDASAMFVVISGEVEVLKKSKRNMEARVAVLGPGDWFGEMSIVDIQPRSATVRALAPSRLLRVSSADLDALYLHDLRSYAIIILNLARELSRRLRVADGIRQGVEDHPFPGRETQPEGKVTVSLGVVSFPEDGADRVSLMQCADEALYRAKQSGRNRVCDGKTVRS